MSSSDDSSRLIINLRIGGIGAAIGAAVEFVLRRLINPSSVCSIDQWTNLFSSGGFQAMLALFIIAVSFVVPTMYYMRLQMRRDLAGIKKPAQMDNQSR